MNSSADTSLWAPIATLGPVTSLWYGVLESSSSQNPIILIGTGLSFVIAVLWLLFRNKPHKAFRNEKGQKIKLLSQDARLAKFIRAHELSKKGEMLAGKCPYLIQSGPYQELVISQPRHIQDFYKEDARRHSKPKNFNFGVQFGRLMGDAVGANYGDSWRKIRKHFDPEFSLSTITQIIPRFCEEITHWVTDLATGNKAVVNCRKSFELLMFRLLAIQLYGNAFDEQLYDRLLQLNELHQAVIRDMLTSKHQDSKLWNMWPTQGSRRLREYTTSWRTFNLGVIRTARERSLRCPTEVIYRGVDRASDMEEAQFMQTLDEILFTNVDVSANVISTLLKNLAAVPKVQDGLRCEIVTWKRQPDFDIAKLITKPETLLNRVVMESMRLSPAFWFSMPESIACSKIIGGYSIPAETPVIVDTRRLNREAVTWGDDGETFRPERFAEMPQERLRNGFMRFGAGAASGRCLGKHTADIVFKLVMMTMLENFAIAPFEGTKVGDLELTRLK